ncbi:MAG: trypsin-like peptidase domain-containing protein [Chloroflexota bacterium]|nr:trypsin-like peptidase domain-containing protein [Chloroflexota bacterium]MDE2908578.1 trypsin-like peptidase domain-containing protein [Chloroflexota bacterium]
MTSLLQQLSTGMADLVEARAESVVQVDARRRMPASGIAWSADLVVCAHHTVEIEDDIGVGTADGERMRGTLIGRDPRIDLALLRVDGSLKPAEWAAQAHLRTGNLVLALGRPRQNIRAALGIVTGLSGSADSRRQIKRMKAQFWREMKGDKRRRKGRKWRKRFARDGGNWALALAGGVIHSDVVMYPGFSGGPLLAADGKVYGMNTSGFPGGASTAIPLASISDSVAALLAKGKIQTGYLGIGVQTAQLPDNVAESLDQDEGLLIVSIEAGSPAAQAGLLVGDILTALDGEPLERIDELQVILTRLDVGAEASTQFARGGDLRDGSVMIGEK